MPKNLNYKERFPLIRISQAMEEIEYLEEYEDLILPTINSNSGGTAAASATRPTPPNNTMPGSPQQDDEDSSSIDQDIFESLFDDHSDDDNILQKKVDPKLSQRHDEHASMDSLDMLVKDLVGDQLTQTTSTALTMDTSDFVAGNPNKVTPKSAATSTSAVKERVPIAKSTKSPSSIAPSLVGGSVTKTKPSSSVATTTTAKTKFDPKRLVKPKSVATVRPTVQNHPQKRINPAAKMAAIRNLSATAAPRNTSGASSSAQATLVKTTGASATSRPSPSAASVAKSSTSFTSSAQKQIAAATSTTSSTAASATSTPKPSGSGDTSGIQKRIVRPPPTIIKPEKLQSKDPVDDPLCLDDIGDLGSDSEFSLSNISAESLDNFSDLEDPDQVIELSNDSSNGRRAQIKSLDNIVRRTPSPTVSEDFKSHKDDSGDDLLFHSLNNSSKTDENLENIVDLLDDESPGASGATSDNKPTNIELFLPSIDEQISPNVTITGDTLLTRIDEVLLESEKRDKQNTQIEKANMPEEKNEEVEPLSKRQPAIEQEQQTITKTPTENESTLPTTTTTSATTTSNDGIENVANTSLEKTPTSSETANTSTTSKNIESEMKANDEATLELKSVEETMDLAENETLEESSMGEVAAEEIVCDTDHVEHVNNSYIPSPEFPEDEHNILNYSKNDLEMQVDNNKINETVQSGDGKLCADKSNEAQEQNPITTELEHDKTTSESAEEGEESNKEESPQKYHKKYINKNKKSDKPNSNTDGNILNVEKLDKTVEEKVENQLNTSVEKNKDNIKKTDVENKLISKSKEHVDSNENEPSTSSKIKIQKPAEKGESKIKTKTTTESNKKQENLVQSAEKNSKNTEENKSKEDIGDNIKEQNVKNEDKTTQNIAATHRADKSQSKEDQKYRETNKIQLNESKDKLLNDSVKDKPIVLEKTKSKEPDREKQNKTEKITPSKRSNSDKSSDSNKYRSSSTSKDKSKSSVKGKSESSDKDKSAISSKEKTNSSDNNKSTLDKDSSKKLDSEKTNKTSDNSKLSSSNKEKSRDSSREKHKHENKNYHTPTKKPSFSEKDKFNTSVSNKDKPSGSNKSKISDSPSKKHKDTYNRSENEKSKRTDNEKYSSKDRSDNDKSKRSESEKYPSKDKHFSDKEKKSPDKGRSNTSSKILNFSDKDKPSSHSSKRSDKDELGKDKDKEKSQRSHRDSKTEKEKTSRLDKESVNEANKNKPVSLDKDKSKKALKEEDKSDKGKPNITNVSKEKTINQTLKDKTSGLSKVISKEQDDEKGGEKKNKNKSDEVNKLKLIVAEIDKSMEQNKSVKEKFDKSDLNKATSSDKEETKQQLKKDTTSTQEIVKPNQLTEVQTEEIITHQNILGSDKEISNEQDKKEKNKSNQNISEKFNEEDSIVVQKEKEIPEAKVIVNNDKEQIKEIDKNMEAKVIVNNDKEQIKEIDKNMEDINIESTTKLDVAEPKKNTKEGTQNEDDQTNVKTTKSQIETAETASKKTADKKNETEEEIQQIEKDHNISRSTRSNKETAEIKDVNKNIRPTRSLNVSETNTTKKNYKSADKESKEEITKIEDSKNVRLTRSQNETADCEKKDIEKDSQKKEETEANAAKKVDQPNATDKSNVKEEISQEEKNEIATSGVKKTNQENTTDQSDEINDPKKEDNKNSRTRRINEAEANAAKTIDKNTNTENSNKEETQTVEHKSFRSTRSQNEAVEIEIKNIEPSSSCETKSQTKSNVKKETIEDTNKSIVKQPTTIQNASSKESPTKKSPIINVVEEKDSTTRRSLRKRCAESPNSTNDAGKKLFKTPPSTSFSRSRERVNTPVNSHLKRNLKSPVITTKRDESPLTKKQKLDSKQKSNRLRNNDYDTCTADLVDDGWETDNSVTSQKTEDIAAEIFASLTAESDKSPTDNKTQNSKQLQDNKAAIAAVAKEEQVLQTRNNKSKTQEIEPDNKLKHKSNTYTNEPSKKLLRADATTKSSSLKGQPQQKLPPKTDGKTEQKPAARSLETSPQRATKGNQKSGSGNTETKKDAVASRKSQRSRAGAHDDTTEEEDPLNISVTEKYDATLQQKQQERKSQRPKTVVGGSETKDLKKLSSPQKPQIASSTAQGTQLRLPTQRNTVANRWSTKTETVVQTASNARKATTSTSIKPSPTKSPGSTVMTLSEWLDRQKLQQAEKNRLKQTTADQTTASSESNRETLSTVEMVPEDATPPPTDKTTTTTTTTTAEEIQPDAETSSSEMQSKSTTRSKLNSKQRKTAAKSKAIVKKSVSSSTSSSRPKLKSEIEKLMDGMSKEMKDGGVELLIRESRTRVLKRDSLVATPVPTAGGTSTNNTPKTAATAKMVTAINPIVATSTEGVKTATAAVAALATAIKTKPIAVITTSKTLIPTKTTTATTTDKILSPTTSKITVGGARKKIISTAKTSMNPVDLSSTTSQFKIPQSLNKPIDTDTEPLLLENQKLQHKQFIKEQNKSKKRRIRKCRVRISRTAVAAYWKRQTVLKRLLTSSTNNRSKQIAAAEVKFKGVSVPADSNTSAAPAALSTILPTLAAAHAHALSPPTASESLLSVNIPDQSNVAGRANILTIPPQNRRPPSTQIKSPRIENGCLDLSPQGSAELLNDMSDDYLLTPMKATTNNTATPTAAVAATITTTTTTSAPTTVTGGRRQAAQQKRNVQQTTANKEKKQQPPRTTKSTYAIRSLPKQNQANAGTVQQAVVPSYLSTATPQTQSSPFPQVEPKTELDENAQTPTRVTSIGGISSGSFGVTPTTVDSNGTRLYSFLHPAKYNRGHGGVLLDYCCPNLDGPMPAIDPTRIHAQVQSTVRELPAYIVMTTKLITRADAESNKSSIPASIRQKIEKITAANANTTSSSLTAAAAATTTAPAAPTSQLTLPPPPQLTPSLSLLQKQLPLTTTIRQKIIASADASPPQLTPFSALEAALNLTTPVSASSSSPAATSIAASNAADSQRSALRCVLRRFDMQLKRNNVRFGALTFTERQRVIESCVNSSVAAAFSPKDVDTATRLLEEYQRQMASLLKPSPTYATLTPSAAAVAAASASMNASAILSAAQQFEHQQQSAGSQQNASVSDADVPQSQLSSQTRHHVPIYDNYKNIIGYQLKVGVNTKSTMSTHSDCMSTTSTSTTVNNASTNAAAATNTSAASSSLLSGLLKLPVQDSPRIFYTKPSSMQTSTPISGAVATGSAPTQPPPALPLSSSSVVETSKGAARSTPRLGRGITIRQITTSSSAPSTTTAAAAPQRLPTLTRNPHIAAATISLPSPQITSTSGGVGVANKSPSVTITAPKRLTRKTAAAAAGKVIVITKDHEGNPQHSAQLDECILPDDDNNMSASGGGLAPQIKCENVDEDFLISGD